MCCGFIVFVVRVFKTKIMNIVNEILEREQKKAEKYKPINVDKHLDVELDIGTLLALDTNDLDTKALK